MERRLLSKNFSGFMGIGVEDFLISLSGEHQP